MNKIGVLLLLFICVENSSAQQKGYSSGNPSAVRAYEQALYYYDARKNEKALEALKSAIERDSLFVEAYSMQGNIYDDLGKLDPAIESYRKAINAKADFFPNNYFFLGSDEFKKSMYSEAKTDL